MTWTQLLANNEIQRHKTSKKELDKLRAVVGRDLAHASLDGASPPGVSRPRPVHSGDCLVDCFGRPGPVDRRARHPSGVRLDLETYRRVCICSFWCASDRISEVGFGSTHAGVGAAVTAPGHLRHPGVLPAARNRRLKLGPGQRDRHPHIGTDVLLALAPNS